MRTITLILIVPWIWGCAQVVGIEQDSYLVESDQGSAGQTAAAPEASVPSSPGQDASPSPGVGSWCGNDTCDWSEDRDSCPGDCPLYMCGNHACEAGEDLVSCKVDCGEPSVCGDSKCEPDLGERSYNCADDCPP